MLVVARKKVVAVFSILLGFIAGGVFFVTTHWYSLEINDTRGGAEIVVDFKMPMKKLPVEKIISISPEIPGSPLRIKSMWLNDRTMVLMIREVTYPKGQQIKFSLKAPTVLPGIKKYVSGSFRSQIMPELLSIGPDRIVPTRGPVMLKFNTMIEPKSFKGHVVINSSGTFIPLKKTKGEEQLTDYSTWLFKPAVPLKNQASYTLTLKIGLMSMGGKTLKKETKAQFITAAKPHFFMEEPEPGARDITPIKKITFSSDEVLKEVKVDVKEVLLERRGRNRTVEIRKAVPGRVELKGKEFIFVSDHILEPGAKYEIKVKGVSRWGEPSDPQEFSFETADMENKLWVEVSMVGIHKVTIYRGKMPIKYMIASGGKKGQETPEGTFYIQDRGHSFFSYRFDEGASYWVRFKDQYLFHSVPFDKNWKIKEDEHAKLGLPASHGCVRLSLRDAKWFYMNIPSGAMVIIHR